VLIGGGGTDKLFQGDNDSKELRAGVQAAMPNWSSAFIKVSLPVMPFGANTELVKGHKEVDVDLLGFTASPWGAFNLMAAQAPGMLSPSAPPSAATVDALVAQAKQQWLATGLADTNLLDGIRVKVADLGGKDPLLLGRTQGNVITLDDDAAGWGWFADLTPAQSEEYRPMPDGSLRAKAKSDAAGRMDMLTVISHEIVHILGFEHSEAGNGQATRMDATLAVGVRDLPPLSTTVATQLASERKVPASSAEVSYFDTESGAFHKSGLQPAPAANREQDEFMVVMDQASKKPRHELYELKPAYEKALHSVVPVIQPDENDSLISRLKKLAVRINSKK
jgi:hypothetical protein